MAMNDEETVALIAGGHTFGKTHGAGDPSFVGAPSRKVPSSRIMGLGWRSKHGTGLRCGRDHRRPGSHVVADADSSGATTTSKTCSSLSGNLRRVQAGAYQWQAKDAACRHSGPVRPGEEACSNHVDLGPRVAGGPGLRKDLAAASMSNPDQFADAFARAWFKLTHRDMGPIQRYLGPLVPKETLIWQDRDPGRGSSVDRRTGDRGAQGHRSLPPGCRCRSSSRPLGRRPRRSAFSDKRGGANGARIRLAPQKDWKVNNPAELANVLQKLEAVQTAFNTSGHRREEGLACRPDRSRRLCCNRARRRRRPGPTSRCRSRPAAWTRRQEQTDAANRSLRWNRPPTVSATTMRRARSSWRPRKRW